MDKFMIVANFHVYVAQGKNLDDTDKPDRKVTFSKGMVVDANDIPEGQTADDWVAKELATVA